ncbi:NADH:flavin oxidoreductase/NADH oxidase [Pseudooceanicola marinus]|uniref:oxidoreductase n=1 Tax=Pseudooceanicola marinus TaxID=396013 RepID=UPI001CD386AC|nr:NADH:flavin oxidoreductase/NADH oxidase [Pseudooceanicola marinus]MCA1335603.1 NADH:flavin oxidoreductase/NADH oxidase [Pseudooceanicola marinus]
MTDKTTGPSALFTPLIVRGVTFHNRLLLSPMCQYAAEDGRATGWHFDHYAHMAMSGLGGALIEATAVQPEGRITPDCLGAWSDDQIPGLAMIAEAFHRHGVPAGVQLAHAGRKASTEPPWNGAKFLPAGDPRRWTCVAPSAVPYADGWPAPAELSLDDIAALRAAFVAAAQRAMAAGFDFVEIHGAHGYLLHSFVSPLSNRRTDGYGGSAEARHRLPVEIAQDLRAALPEDMPIFYRASCVDRVEGGLDLEDTVALAAALKGVGVDVVDCSAGGIAPGTNGSQVGEEITAQHDMAARVRAEAGVATMAVGGTHSPAVAMGSIDDGKADLVAVASEMLNNFDFPRQCAEAAGVETPDFIQPHRYAFYNQFARGAS